MTILDEFAGLAILIITIYIVCNIPAIIMLVIGIRKLKTKPSTGKLLIILACMYFIIGLGICGSMMN